MSLMKQEMQSSTIHAGPVSIRNQTIAPDIDEIIGSCIDVIFAHYDDDNNGYLNKEECFQFFTESVNEFTVDHPDITEDEDEEESRAKQME